MMSASESGAAVTESGAAVSESGDAVGSAPGDDVALLGARVFLGLGVGLAVTGITVGDEVSACTRFLNQIHVVTPAWGDSSLFVPYPLSAWQVP